MSQLRSDHKFKIIASHIECSSFVGYVYILSCDVCLRPFSVSPDNGDLAVGACMQITVEYLSAQVGVHAGEMVLHYDTGWWHAGLPVPFIDY